MFDFGSKNQKPTAMGLFKFLEKGANKFFDGLKKNAADSVTKKAGKAKLPPEAKKAMEDMKKQADEIEDIFADL